MGRRITTVILALFMIITIAFCTDLPVSAAEMGSSVVTTEADTVSVGAIKIRWNKISGASYYRIWRKTPNGSWKKLKTVYGSVSSYLDSGLTSGTTYYYAVRGYGKTDGKWVWSKYKTLKTETARLADVTASATLVSSSRIDVTWNQAAKAGGYYIWRKSSGETEWTRLKNVSASVSSYSDTDVSSGNSYVYCVRAYRTQGGKTNWSKVISSNTVSISSENNSRFTTAQKEVMKKIIYAVETGGQVYGNQDYSDFTGAFTNSSIETAITIGAGQWYGTEAKRLLQLIYQKYPETFQAYDKNGELWKDVCNADWSTYKLSKSSGKAKKIVNIISSEGGIKCQDALMYEQIMAMETIVRNLGVTEVKAVGECINIMHQGGQSAVTRILGKVDAKNKSYTLDNIYEAMSTDTGNQVGTYKTRQAKVYEWLKEYMK